MGLQNDLTLSCNEQVRSSFKRIFLAPACDITAMTASTTAMAFTAITMASTADVFYEYEFEPFTTALAGEGENENGTATSTPTFTGQIKGLDKTKLKRLQDVADERKIVAILESTNKAGTYNRAFVIGWDAVIGRDAAANVNINYQIEAALNGDNSATLTLSATHAEVIRELVGSIDTNSSGTVSFGS